MIEETAARVDEEIVEDEQYTDEELEQLRRQDIRTDMGVNYDKIATGSRLKRRVFEFMYDPRTEIAIFGMIILSIVLLVMEVSQPEVKQSSTWLGGVINTDGGWLFWADVAFSVFFLLEYVIKLWIAPRKWYFVRTNWIDLLAILPVLRIFRIGRAVRLLRLLRLLRLMRVGQIMQQRVNGLSDELQRRTAENMIIFIYLVFSLLFGTIGVLVFEKGVNPGFNTLGDGLWWCVVTLTTVGYGDISPQTAGGKVVAGIVMFIGLSFYALLTGVLSTVIIERTKRNEVEGMEIANLRDHVVVCGWNETGRRLVADLVQSEKDPKILVLYHESKYPRLLDPNVHYVEEDPSTGDALERARIKHAAVAVILPDVAEGRSSQDADARSILTILAIEQMNPRIHTIVELLNEQNTYHVRNAGCDEVIVSGAFTGGMLSQAVQYPGISDVFGDLFAPGTGTYMHERTVSEQDEGKRFSEVSGGYFAQGEGVVMGYRRDGVLMLSPGEDVVMQREDRVLMLKRVV